MTDMFPVIDVTCPECQGRFKVYGDGAPSKVWKPLVGDTTDCYHCDALLLFTEGKVVEFHSHMRSKMPAWDADTVFVFELEGVEDV